MKVNEKWCRTIWFDENNVGTINIIDQRFLPHQFIIEKLNSFDEIVVAIKDMHVRGAGLIGAAAACAMYRLVLEASECLDFDKHFIFGCEKLISSRPTAVNLAWAVNRQMNAIGRQNKADEKIAVAYKTALAIMDEDALACKNIGKLGVGLISEISERKGKQTVNILTHCNAGWLAFVDYGSALSPVYEAFELGIDVHVWVDETRPRNQGASLTAWELLNHGIKHTIIADNTGGHLMQNKMVDMVIVGADRISANGDAANKIGTYLKALAAHDNNIPFYVAAPSSTFDLSIYDGLAEIPIEVRDANEVKYVRGVMGSEEVEVLIAPVGSPAVNYGFDVTPNRLITALISEKGICKANRTDISKMLTK